MLKLNGPECKLLIKTKGPQPLHRLTRILPSRVSFKIIEMSILDPGIYINEEFARFTYPFWKAVSKQNHL